MGKNKNKKKIKDRNNTHTKKETLKQTNSPLNKPEINLRDRDKHCQEEQKYMEKI